MSDLIRYTKNNSFSQTNIKVQVKSVLRSSATLHVVRVNHKASRLSENYIWVQLHMPYLLCM